MQDTKILVEKPKGSGTPQLSPRKRKNSRSEARIQEISSAIIPHIPTIHVEKFGKPILVLPNRKAKTKPNSARGKLMKSGRFRLPNPMDSSGSPRQTRAASEPILEEKKMGDVKLKLIIEEVIKTEQSFLNSINYLITPLMPGKMTVAEYLYDQKAIDERRYELYRTLEVILREMSACSMELIRNLSKKRSGSSIQNMKSALSLKNIRPYFDAFHNYILFYQKNKKLLRSNVDQFIFTRIENRLKELTGDQNDLASHLIQPIQRLPRVGLLFDRMLKEPNAKNSASLKATRKELSKELELIGSSNMDLDKASIKLKLRIGSDALDSIIGDIRALKKLQAFENRPAAEEHIQLLINTARAKGGSMEAKGALKMYDSNEALDLFSSISSRRGSAIDLKKIEDKKNALHTLAVVSLGQTLENYQERYGSFKIKASSLEEVLKNPSLDHQFSLYMLFTKQDRFLRAYYELKDLADSESNHFRKAAKLNMIIVMYLEETSVGILEFLGQDLKHYRTFAKLNYESLKVRNDTKLNAFIAELQKRILDYLEQKIAPKLLKKTEKEEEMET